MNTANSTTSRYVFEDLISSIESYQSTLIITDDFNGNESLFVEDFHFLFVNFNEAITILNSKKPSAIFILHSAVDKSNLHFNYVRLFAKKNRIPLVLYSRDFSADAQKATLEFEFDDYYCGDFSLNCVSKIRLTQKVNNYKYEQADTRTATLGNVPLVRRWKSKRAFDIVVSLALITLLSPLLILVAILIKLESKGPIFYISKRAGNGYNIFDFYKFRSMRDGADVDLKKLSSKNQYGDSVFFKIENDPRVTRLGGILRNTSLDELPQLFNVLKGDMSLVGNRPLPLYEAKNLTTDGVVRRFLAPAGITGLWQVTKRGKKEMSDTERIQLDIIYARKISFFYDLKILLSTFPALIQQGKV